MCHSPCEGEEGGGGMQQAYFISAKSGGHQENAAYNGRVGDDGCKGP